MFKTKLSFCLFVISLFCGLTHLAQAKQYSLEQINVSEGLPSTLINKIFQQQNGYLWFASDGGVSRFDGINFVHYRFSPDEPRHISNNFVNEIVEDEQGNLWFATEDGLNKLLPDGSIEIYYQGHNGLPSSWITDIYIDSKKQMWLGTGAGLAKANPDGSYTTFKLLHQTEDNQPNYYNSTIYSIVEDDNGAIWAGTDIGLAILKPGKSELVLFKEQDSSYYLDTYEAPKQTQFFGDYFLTAQKHENGKLLFGTQYSGLLILDPDTGKVDQYSATGSRIQGRFIPNNTIEAITQKNASEYWLSTNSGAIKLNIDTGEFEHIEPIPFEPTSLPSKYVNHIFIDNAGITWFATNQGVAFYSPLRDAGVFYKPRPLDTQLSASTAFSFAVQNENILYAATEGGLDRILLDEQISLLDPLKKFFEDNKTEVWGVRTDKLGNLWLAHPYGLTRIKGDKVDHYSSAEDNKHGFPEREFYTAEPDNKGGVWITGYMMGALYFHPENNILNSYLDDINALYLLGGNFSFQTIIAQDGKLWLATTNGVFVVTPGKEGFEHISFGSAQENIRVGGLFQSQDGAIWAATLGLGLAKIVVDESSETGFSIEYFNQDHGLADNRLKAVVGDKQGRLWLTSQQDLVMFNPKTQRFVHYPSLFNERNLNFSESALTITEKYLIAGSNRGVLQVDINKLTYNRFEPKVHITSAIIAGNDYHQVNNQDGSPLTFDYDQNVVQFAFAALDYTEPARNQYRYQLMGFDNDWIDAQSTPQAMYTNLPPGKYTFRVQGSNSDGIWSPYQANFSFTIKQPWWLYTLFILASIIVLMTCLYVVNRFRQINELKMRANYDTLTGLANRYFFNQTLDRTLSNETQSGAVVFIDLDHFKEVNDTLGHDVGDELIIQVGKRLKHTIKQQDTLARLGGDEFAVIINGPLEQENLIKIAQRLKEAMAAGYLINDNWINSSASIGIARFPEDGADSKTLLKHADTAMYAAKNQGRNDIYFFNQALSDALMERLSIKQKLADAITEQQFKLYYQPKLSLPHQHIVGFEGLLRWHHPEDGFIAPDKFIPEAEQSGQIIEIGLWVLEQACIQGKAWDDAGLLQTNLSINISPVQLNHATIVEDIEQILAKTGFAPNKLELEITESILIENVELAKTLLSRLKAIGVRVALDDFGKGYSSLNYLTQFPIDTLKIDKGFMDAVLQSPENHLVLKNIINLGNELNLDVVAEGVETQAQLNLLLQYQCHCAQGYLFNPPMPVDKIIPLLNPVALSS
ncbi:EAL domain-containing protein [Shewanella sp. WXL01]|uniref:EAL domain-containing protein n=1 Tax=Shewanella sp. WXL01 TaxID=2709721 RepID=UPI00143832DE|nr:EAL domain-containing protein [Shewanella sp. WXL01]NKF49741.1 EAL domain-containing protein [Shewanella sp. WXL01]